MRILAKTYKRILTIAVFAFTVLSFSARDVKVKVQLKETGATITDIVPMASSLDFGYRNTGVLCADSCYVIESLPEESLYIILGEGTKALLYQIDDTCKYLTLPVTREQLSALMPEELGELTVEGRTQYIEGKKGVFLPTKQEKKISRGGIGLLENMAIPVLRVDLMTQNVTTTSGDGVSFFIDKHPADQNQVRNLRAMDVERVEYLEAPEDPMYMGARYVVNYVMVQYEYGGYVNVAGSQKFNTDRGGYSASTRFQKGRMTYDMVGGFNYEYDNHSGSDVEAEYIFPGQTIKTHSTYDGAATGNRNGYGTLRAIYSGDKTNILNTVGLSGANVPKSRSFNHVEYTPAIYPPEETDVFQHQSNFSAAWQGNYNFSLPSNWSLNIATSASYSKYKSNYLYNSDVTQIQNLADDNSYSWMLNTQVTKSFGRHQIGLRIVGSGNGNSVSYSGTSPSKQHGHTYDGVVDIPLHLNFSRFWLMGNFGGEYMYQNISGISYSHFSPKVYANMGYQISRTNNFNVFMNYYTYNSGMSAKTGNRVLVDMLNGSEGNPYLKDGIGYDIGLNYNFIPNNRIGVSAFYQFSRLVDIIMNVYWPTEIDGRPIMMHRSENCGFFNSSNYGVNLSYRFPSIGLTLSGNMSGQTIVRHTDTHYNGTILTFGLQGLYNYKNVYARAGYNYHRHSIVASGRGLSPAFYRIELGWANDNWNVSLTATNPSVGNYFGGVYRTESPVFNDISYEISSAYHRTFGIKVNYSFSYGKRIPRGDEPSSLSGASSGIIQY